MPDAARALSGTARADPEGGVTFRFGIASSAFDTSTAVRCVGSHCLSGRQPDGLQSLRCRRPLLPYLSTNGFLADALELRRHPRSPATATPIGATSLLEACSREFCDCTQRRLRGIPPEPNNFVRI